MMGNLNKSSFNTLSCLSGNNRLKGGARFVRHYSTVGKGSLPKGSPELITEFVNKYDSDCFSILIIHSKKHKLGESVNLSFSVNLPIYDPQLIKFFSEFFDCGVLVERKDCFNFTIKDFTNITEKVIPFFNQYSLDVTSLGGKKHLRAFNL